jgi:hypothetical protein
VTLSIPWEMMMYRELEQNIVWKNSKSKGEKNEEMQIREIRWYMDLIKNVRQSSRLMDQVT